MMSWKKNAISYLIWSLYTIMTGTMLLALATEVCTIAGIERYMGIPIAVACVAVAGGAAFLLHRLAMGRVSFAEEKRVHFTVLGILLSVALLVVGFSLRAQQVGGAEYSTSVYYEAAKVTEGQGIPQSVHGAVYFYVWLLHGVLLLLGNYASAGIWVQIVLQLAASFLLFLVVRKLVGFIAGLAVLGFCMLAPYMVDSCLVLSPDMLYFFLLMVAASLMTIGYGNRGTRGTGCIPGLRLAACFFMGIVIAMCCYLDMTGLLLLPVAFGYVFCFRECAVGTQRKAKAVALCVAGVLQGICACIFLDACLSGKVAQRVAEAWLSLYRPEGFRLPTEMSMNGSVPENCVLFGVMAFGIFSFWFDKRKERISMLVVAVCGIIAASCFGVFTEEMPGFFYLYLAFILLAGIGFGQCFYAEPAGQEKETPAAEEKPDLEILMEARDGTEAGWEPEQARRGLKPEKTESEQPGRKRPVEAAVEAAPTDGKVQVQFLENPLPLPKKHVKRVMDYSLPSGAQDDDFDYPVAEGDDFDV